MHTAIRFQSKGEDSTITVEVSGLYYIIVKLKYNQNLFQFLRVIFRATIKLYTTNFIFKKIGKIYYTIDIILLLSQLRVVYFCGVIYKLNNIVELVQKNLVKTRFFLFAILARTPHGLE